MDSDDIAARWPHLVHVRVSAFGADSPWPDAEPIAALVEARLGVMAEQDGPASRPHYLGHPSTIYATAMLGVIGALAALPRPADRTWASASTRRCSTGSSP